MVDGPGLDRRGLLVAGAAGALLAGCGSASGGGGRRRSGDQGADADVLNRLLALEHRAVALYAAQDGRLARRILAHEREHAARLQQAVRELGGEPVGPAAARKGDGPPLELARRLEETSVAAYLDALPAVGDAGTRGLLAGILATEAEHLAVVQEALGRPASDAAFVTGRRSR